jgi:tetratricopeptide (TPR) repeat protein
MGLSVMPVGALILIMATALPALSQSKPAKMGRVGCPHCVNDGSPISRSLQRVDELYASFETKEAHSELLKVLVLDPQNAEALSKMARVYIDFADLIPESSPDWREKRNKEYRTAEDYARKAIQADPNSTWGHFYVAASLGSIASLSPIAKQIDLAGEIRAAVEKAIALDPQNGFAYHVYGIWHRKMAEIGKASRLFATVLYGRSIPRGSFEISIDYLQRAIALNPTVIASRLELARSYAAIENWPLARHFLTSVRQLPIQFSDDAKHKEKAEQLLEEIKER